MPAALYQGHFTSRLKKALASRGPVTPVRTVIKRTPFISVSLSLFSFSSSPLVFSAEKMPLPVTLVPFEAKSISMSTFVLFSEGPTAPMGLLCAHSRNVARYNVRFSERPRVLIALLNFLARRESRNGYGREMQQQEIAASPPQGQIPE